MAADKEFLIPLGADLTSLLSALREGRTNVKALEDQSKQSSKNMQDAFSQVIRSQKEIVAESVSGSRAIKDEAQQAILLGNVFKQLADSSSKATDTNKLKKYADEFKKLADFAQKGLRVNVSDEELTLLTTLLNATKNEMEELAAVVTILKGKLDTMDPRSEEWEQLNQAIQLSEKVIQDFGQAEDGVEKKTVSLRTQLRTMKQELALMEEQGLEGTKSFEQMQIAAAQLEDQLGDTAARVRALASDTKYVDAAIQAASALTAGFGLAQGAVALFGSENEELAKVLNKVQGAMVILNSLQQIQQLLQKQNVLAILTSRSARIADTAATVAHSTAVGTDATVTNSATVATKGFSAALAANPLGLILVALGAVIAAVSAFTSKTENAAEAQEELNKKIVEFADLSKSAELGYIERTNQLLIAEAKARGENEQKIQNIEINSQRQKVRSLERYYEEVKGVSIEKEIETGQALKDEKVKLRVLELNASTDARKKQAELSKKYNDEALRKEEAYQQAIDSIKKRYRDLTIANIVSERERSKKEAAAKANDEISEINKLIAEQKKAGKLSNELEQAAKNAKLQVRLRYNTEVLKIDLDFYKQQEDLLKAANDAINDINKSESQKQIDDINARYDAIIENLNNSNKKLGEQSSLSAQDIAIIEKNNNAIFDLNTARDAEIIRTKQAYALAKLDIEEKLAIDTIELQKFSGLTEQQVEKLKEEQKILIKKQFGQKRLDLIKEQLIKENKLTEEQFAAITDQKNIDEAAKAGQDIFSYLGLSNKLSDETKAKILAARAEAAAEIKKPVKSVGFFELFGISTEDVSKITIPLSAIASVWKSTFEAMLIPINNLVNARKQAVDEITKDIDELEKQLEREKEAREKGYANNVDLLNKEIAEKKAKKDEELKNLEEAQKKQRQLQKLQIIADTLSQVNNLATSATEIMKFLSPLGPFGVALGIATIGTMIGAFVATKVAALKAVNEAPQFDEGGGLVLEGPDHSQGGLDVVEKRTGKTKANVRGGEYMYVFKHTKAKEFEDVFNLINDNQGASLSDVLKEIGGIHIIEDAPKIIMPILQKRNEEENDYRNAMITMAYNSDELISIKKELKEFKEAWQTEPRVVDYGDFVEITMGNIRKKVKKSKS